MPDETPAERLRSAAAYVRDHYVQGKLVDKDGNVCAMGAIFQLRSANDRLIYHPAFAREDLLAADDVARRAAVALSDYLAAEGPADLRMPVREMPHYSPVARVEEWNDDYVCSGTEVAEAMEKAATRWEERRA